MIVKLSISQWAARKYDKKVSNKVASDYNANSDMGRYNKSLMAKEANDAIKKIANKMRVFHYENTLPWDDQGSRLLPSKNFMKYSDAMRQFTADFNAAVDDFRRNYQGYVDQAAVTLGGLYNPADYPMPSEIADKFGVRVQVDPFPDSDDFRVSLADDEVNRIKTFIDERNKVAIAHANKELWTRLYNAVNSMVDRLSEKDAIFRDSLVGNIAELCQLLPKLNITDDQELEQMRIVVEKQLSQLSPDILRQNEAQRAAAANDAKKILTDMKSKFDWGSVANAKHSE